MMFFGFCLMGGSLHAFRSLKQTEGSTDCPWTTILVSKTVQQAFLVKRRIFHGLGRGHNSKIYKFC